MLPTKNDLYIISDDDIEEGDWCLFFWDGMRDGELGQVGSEPQQYFPENGHTLNRNLRKIIATTDKLMLNDLSHVPQPSIAFIDMYRKSGGISEIDVAYTYESRVDMNGSHTVSHPRVRVDSYNCITAIPILH